MNQVLRKFYKNNKNSEFWPPLNNVSAFLWQWNEKNLFSCFKDKTSIDLLIFSNLDISFGFFSSNKLFKISKEFFVNYFEDNRILSNKKKNFKNIEKEIDRDYYKFTDSFILDKSDEFLSKSIVDVMRRCWLSNGIVWFSVYGLEPDFFFKKISLPIKEQEVLDIWSRAIIPINSSFNKAHLLLVLSLVSEGRTLNDIIKACQYFYATYHSIPSISDVKSKIESEFGEYLDKPQKASQQLESIKRKQQLTLDKHTAWKKTLNFRQKKIVNYIQAVIEFRDLRKETFNKSFVIAWKIAEELLNRAGLDKKYIPFILPEEYERGINFIKKLKPKLDKRIKGFGLYMSYNGEKEFFYQDCAESRLEIDKFYFKTLQDNKDKKNIKGRVGAPGKVTGIVRKVAYFDRNSYKTFKSGEILVTGMTRPEFMPLLKKAAAIITDEGGITCHAAIVSRELGKPCIVDTKIATQILKNGDRVEVDANSGIVKILD